MEIFRPEARLSFNLVSDGMLPAINQSTILFKNAD